MKKIIQTIGSFFVQVFNIPTCTKCGSTRLDSLSRDYIRGWNNYCKQASGDRGKYCHNCGKVNFERTLEEYKSKLPKWCTAFSE